MLHNMPAHARLHKIYRDSALGHFLELEVVLSEGEPSEQGVEEAHKLMAALGTASTQLIEGAYVDLLAQKHV
jgi:adenylate cyclase class IV